MRTLLLTAIAIIFLFTLNACDSTKEAQVEGADWEKISEDNETIFYIDLNNITKLPNSHYKVWDKLIIKDPSSKFRRHIAYSEYDCDNNKKRTLQITGYNRDGNARTIKEVQPWRYVAPNTNMEIMFTFICNK